MWLERAKLVSTLNLANTSFLSWLTRICKHTDVWMHSCKINAGATHFNVHQEFYAFLHVQVYVCLQLKKALTDCDILRHVTQN